MINLWTNETIEKILMQLDLRCLPFESVSFAREEGHLKRLGHGASADVFEAVGRGLLKRRYAMKVCGFRDPDMDPDRYRAEIDVYREENVSGETIVKIYKDSDLWVSLDEEDSVVEAWDQKPDPVPQRCIFLRFILMELLTPVITRTSTKKPVIAQKDLAFGEEKEVIKLAFDVTLALKEAHSKNVLHRDIKLENIFFDEKKGVYKLGDFGIARRTEDGFAEAVECVGTKGYIAPEVQNSDESYDCTADIYSLGVTLFLLMNGLKFPGSRTYSANRYEQYSEGYVFPTPEGKISERFDDIILKACSYNPADRYQSATEMLADIQGIMYGESVGYRAKHNGLLLVMFYVMLSVGTAAWKLTVEPDKVITYGLWEWFFILSCLLKSTLAAFGKKTWPGTLLTFATGIGFLITGGFIPIRVFLVLVMLISFGYATGVYSTVRIIPFLAFAIRDAGGVALFNGENSGWIGVTALLLAVFMAVRYFSAFFANRSDSGKWSKLHHSWFVEGMLFFELILLRIIAVMPMSLSFIGLLPEYLLSFISGRPYREVEDLVNFTMVGLAGLAFCIVWWLREIVLSRINRTDRIDQ